MSQHQLPQETPKKSPNNTYQQDKVDHNQNVNTSSMVSTTTDPSGTINPQVSEIINLQGEVPQKKTTTPN